MNIATILPILLSTFAGQEKTFALSEGTALLTAENARVKAGLTPEQIAAIVAGLVQLAFAEQTALVASLTQKTAVK